MNLALILFLGGAVVIAWIFFWSRLHRGQAPAFDLDQMMQSIPSASQGDALLVSQEHGKLIYANEPFRKWLNTNGGVPHLEQIAQIAEPSNSFLELFAHEGQSSFQLGRRWVEASSHRIPYGSEMRTVVVMRELSNNTSNPDALNISVAMSLINDIGETVNVSMGVEPALQALLMLIHKVVEFDAGEVCLWRESERALYQGAWVGDGSYLIALMEAGGRYEYDEGVTGWIARHRQPVLIEDRDDLSGVQPKLMNNPYRCFVGVPLTLGDRFIGTLELAHNTPGIYTQGDMALLQAISKQVAVTIFNAEIYAEQMRRVDDLASLQKVIRSEHSGQDDAVSVYAALNQRIAQLLNADMSGIFLYDDDRRGLMPEPPFYGLPEALVRTIFIPMPADSPQRDIWENQPYWVSNDVVGEPLAEALGLQSVIEVAGVSNTAWVPLEIGDQRMGVLAVSNKHTDGGFTARDIKNLSVLASQASIVIENIRLYQRERRLDTELVGLQELTNAIGALSHETEFYSEITERIARLMDISMCGILLYDAESRSLVSKIPFFGVADELIKDYVIHLEPGTVMQQLWEDELAWYSNRVQSDTLVYAAGLNELAEQIGVQKTLIVALYASGRKLGVVQASNKTSGADFTDSDVRLLMIFATQAAAIIENARLYQEARRSAEQAQGLRRVAELAGNVLTTQETFTPVLAEVAQMTSSEVVFVNVLNQQNGSLITYPRWVYGMELVEPIIQDIYSPGFEHSVTASHRPYMSNDVLNDERVLPGYKQLSVKLNLSSAILVPLVYGDRTLGELGVANRTEGVYTKDDLSVMQVIAAQAAAALDRLLLYEATGQNLSRRLDELDAISRVSNELTTTLDLDQVLNVIREEIIRATNADGCTIALLLPQEQWRYPDLPQMSRRLGQMEGVTGLLDIEREAIARGADTVLVSDYEFSAMSPEPEGVRSAIAAAVLYLDQVVGVIHLYKQEVNHFDDRAAAFLMTMAVKASLGYGNAVRYKEQLERSEGLRRRVEQLNRIFELGHMFQTNTDPEVILEAIAYSVQQSVGYDTIVMTMFDTDTGLLRRVAHAGLPVDVFEQTRTYTMTQEDIDNLLNSEFRLSESFFFPIEAVDKWYIKNVEALSTTYEGNRTLEPVAGEGWRDGDMLLVTMKGAMGNIIGIMSLDRPYNNQRPDRGTVEILEIFAHQAATTIENTRLYISSVRNAEQEARLNEVMEAVSQTLDTSDIVQAVAHGALKMLPFSQMTVAIADVEEGFDILRVSIQLDSSIEIVKERRRHLGHSALERTYIEAQDYIYHAGEPEINQYEDLRSWYETGEKTSLILPLQTGGECLGAVHLGSELVNAYGFEEYRQLLRRMAQLVAGAVQNARLFNQAVNLQILNLSVVESIQQGIIVLDDSGYIISANDFVQSRYEWDTDAAVGLEMFEYRPEMTDFLAEDLRIVLEEGIPRERVHQTITLSNGADVISNFYIYPLRYGDIVRGAVIMVEDVTERSRLEQQMESRANQLAALTDVSTRITSSLEREEVVHLALEEMGWLIDYDAMSLWRRNGSYMVLEGANGRVTDSEPGYRFLFSDFNLTYQVVDTQRVAVASSAEQLPDDFPVHEKLESWMGVPLVNQGHVVGMMLLTSQKPAAYESKSDQNIALAFASQVAIALANADLFEQTFDRTNELGTLLEAATATSLTTDLDSVFRTVVELMFSALDMDDCAILIWDEVDNQLEVQLDMNRQGITDRITPKGTIYDLAKYPAKQRALRDREVVVISRDDVNSTYKDELQELIDNQDSARLLVPLVVRDESIGLIQLEQSSRAEGVTQQKVRLARALGSQVAIAIENARLSAQTTVQFEESLIINDLSRAISSTLDLKDMIEITAEQVPAVAGASELYLALYEPATEEITFPLAVRNGERYEIPPRQLGSDEVSFIIRHRRPLSLGADYFSPDELRKSMGITNGEGEVRSYLGVPLTVGDEILGVLAVRDQERTRAFTLNEQRILGIVGAQLGAAVQNARLFNQVQNFAEDLNRQVRDRTYELEEERDRIDTLYQITSELARTLDMERLMPRALGMVAKAVNAQDGVIMQLDPITDQLYSRAVLDPQSLRENPYSDHPFHPAERLARHLIEEDEHVVLVDDLHEAEYWDTVVPGAVEWRSAIAVLLETNEELLGVMVLLSRQPNAFVESHLRLMVAAANQVASSINNAELYKLIRDQAERLGSLLRAEQEEAEKNKAILEGIADGVILADSEGNIVLFNSAAERILKVPRDQAMGQSLRKLTGIYGGSAALWAKAMENRFENFEADGSMEFLDERLQLDETVVSVHLSPVYTGEKFLGTVSVFRDITRDVEVDRIKGEFISNVSHEFRTPLTPIKGFTDLLLMGAAGQLTDKQREILDTIKDNVLRLSALVEDVLNISKIDAGRERLNLENLDLNEVIERIVDDMSRRPHHTKKNIAVNFVPLADVQTIEADHEKVVKILSNIIDNALNYTRADGSIHITLEPDMDKNRMLIKVTDTGVGIPEEFKERIWRRFERHEDTVLALDVAGTGLGLPIVKELVEMHGGEVWFESTLDAGTTFFITLPFRQPEFLKNVIGMPAVNRSN